MGSFRLLKGTTFTQRGGGSPRPDKQMTVSRRFAPASADSLF